MRPIRVLVAEDSLTVRKYLAGVLERAPGFKVVGEAPDGQAAFDLCRSLLPDVVTLDMMMPGMTGLAATEQIMASCPTPIVIVSASVNRAELFSTYDALAAGAVDVLDKPSGVEQGGAWERQFLATVRVASRIRVIRHPRAKIAGAGGEARPATDSGSALARTPGPGGDEAAAAAGARTGAPRLVAVGASTGGPGAIANILRGLPADYPLPILLVMHIGQPFAASFVEWLDGLSPLPVSCATDGEALPPVGTSRVIMAPPDRHLAVRGGRLVLDDGDERHSCRPSVDVLFESVAEETGKAAIACLLTGMGRDGAAGLLAIRAAGGMTLAQDEATSVVFGMPREAIRLGAAHAVLPLGRFAQTLVDLASGAGSGTWTQARHLRGPEA